MDKLHQKFQDFLKHLDSSKIHNTNTIDDNTCTLELTDGRKFKLRFYNGKNGIYATEIIKNKNGSEYEKDEVLTAYSQSKYMMLSIKIDDGLPVYSREIIF